MSNSAMSALIGTPRARLARSDAIWRVVSLNCPTGRRVGALSTARSADCLHGVGVRSRAATRWVKAVSCACTSASRAFGSLTVYRGLEGMRRPHTWRGARRDMDAPSLPKQTDWCKGGASVAPRQRDNTGVPLTRVQEPPQGEPHHFG